MIQNKDPQDSPPKQVCRFQSKLTLFLCVLSPAEDGISSFRILTLLQQGFLLVLLQIPALQTLKAA